jgi:hypothetical protein
MTTPTLIIVPAVVAVLLPLALISYRAGLLRRRWFRWWGGLLAGALLFAAWPRAGIGQTNEDRLRLLIAGGACVFLLLRAAGLPWPTSRRQTACLGVLAALGLMGSHGPNVVGLGALASKGLFEVNPPATVPKRSPSSS